MYQTCSTSLEFPVLVCKHSTTTLITVFSHCSLLRTNHRYIVVNTVPQGTVYHFLLPVLIIPGRRKISNIYIKLMWELKHDLVMWLFHCSPQSSVDISFWVSSQTLTYSPTIENTSTMRTNDETTATQLHSFVSLCCCTGLLLSAILHGIKALHTHHQTFYSVKGRKAILKHPSVLWILAPWNNMYLYSEITYKSRLVCLLMSRLPSTTVSVPLAESHDMWPEIQLIMQTHARGAGRKIFGGFPKWCKQNSRVCGGHKLPAHWRVYPIFVLLLCQFLLS